MRQNKLQEQSAKTKEKLRQSQLNHPILSQNADQVVEYQDPDLWLKSKCHIMTPEEYQAFRANETKTNTTSATKPRVMLDEGYVWEARDYV